MLLSEYYVVISFHKKKSLSCVTLLHWYHMVGGALGGGVCAYIYVCVCACMHIYLPHCVETGKTKRGQASKSVSSVLGEHLSGKVRAWGGVTGGFWVVHVVIQWAITLIGDVNIKQRKTVISSCIHGALNVLVDNCSSRLGRLQPGPWGHCNDASSMAYHLPCQVSSPQSPPWRNWKLQEFMLIAVLVLQFSHHFSTRPPLLFHKMAFLMPKFPYFAVLFDLSIPSPVTSSVSFIPPNPKLYFTALFYIYTYRQVLGSRWVGG